MCVDQTFPPLATQFLPNYPENFCTVIFNFTGIPGTRQGGLHNTTLALDPTFTLDLIHGFSSNLVTKSALDFFLFFGLGQS